MSKRVRSIALLGLALFALALIALALQDPASSPSSTDYAHDADASAESARSLRTQEAADTRTNLASARDGLTTPGAITDQDPHYGALRIRAVWQVDDSPAAGARIYLKSRGSKQRVLSTNTAGELLVEGLTPGIYQAMHDLYSFEVFPIRAGQIKLLEWALLASPGIRGVVRDASGRPVDGVTVRCTDDGGQTCGETTTDDAGRYELANLPVNVNVKATHKDRYSEPRYISLLNPGERRVVDLELVHQRVRVPSHLAGRITVTVADQHGTRTQGATVSIRIKRPHSKIPGCWDTGQPSGENTDAAGEIAWTGIAPGTVLIGAHAPGFAPGETEVELVPGGHASVRVALVFEATVKGTVRDEKGQGLPGVGVTVSVGKRTTHSVRTDIHGCYRISSLRAGTVSLKALRRSTGSASTVLEIIAGQDHDWSPKLDPGPVILGRVFSAQGEPLPEWHVTGLGSRGWCDDGFTDGAGRFRLTNCVESSYEVRVAQRAGFFSVPAVIRKGVVPGGAPLTLLVPNGSESTAFLSGKIATPEGAAPKSLKIQIVETASLVNFVYPVDASTGRFVIGPLPPASYSLSTQSHDKRWADGDLGKFPLAAEERRDIGEHTLVRPVVVEILIHRKGVNGYISGVVYSRGARRHMSQGQVRDKESDVSRLELYSALGPGDYVLVVMGAECVATEVPFKLTRGSTTMVEATMAKGQRFILQVEGLHETLSEHTVTIEGPDAQSPVRYSAWLAKGQSEIYCNLRKGSNRIVVRSKDGRSAEHATVVNGPGKGTTMLR